MASAKYPGLCPAPLCFPAHTLSLCHLWQTLGFQYHFVADISLINVSGADLGTYNPGACLTSVAACLIAQTCPAPQTCSTPSPSSSLLAPSSKVSSLKPPMVLESCSFTFHTGSSSRAPWLSVHRTLRDCALRLFCCYCSLDWAALRWSSCSAVTNHPVVFPCPLGNQSHLLIAFIY